MPQLGKQNPRSLKPTSHDQIFWDNTGVRRLGVRVRPDHPATYVLQYKPTGQAKERRITLGLVNEISLTEARKRATALKASVYEGLDPLKERSSHRTQPTVADAFALHKKHHFPKMSPLSARQRERTFERLFLKPLGNMIFAEVRRRDIAPIIDRARHGKLRPGQTGDHAAINAHRHITAFLRA